MVSRMMLLISVLLASGVEAAKNKCSIKCEKKFCYKCDKCRANFCSPSSPPPSPPPPSPPCQDQLPNCEELKGFLACGQIQHICPVSCGVCIPWSPSPPPAGMRFSIGAATAQHQARLNEAVLKMKTTLSPWASGVDTRTGKPVPRRWHNLTWWDTLVTLHLTGHMGSNPFAHHGPAFPMWHRLYLEVLERVSSALRASKTPLTLDADPRPHIYSHARRDSTT